MKTYSCSYSIQGFYIYQHEDGVDDVLVYRAGYWEPESIGLRVSPGFRVCGKATPNFKNIGSAVATQIAKANRGLFVNIVKHRVLRNPKNENTRRANNRH